jgi:2-polyprenyl-3-methyl-5-hydroxy-6-metoxy-1,4-benzoquinol methylase
MMSGPAHRLDFRRAMPYNSAALGDHDPYSKEHLLSFYNRHLKCSATGPALRWTPQGQLKRYHMLADIAPAAELNNSTVLDYGCGTGDFYRFLQRRGIKVKYTGVDINENFIDLAKKKYPECTFKVMNADDDEFEGFYDYIFICGVFKIGRVQLGAPPPA